MADIELTIRFNQVTGDLSIAGPVENKVMAYGLLEAAKDAIRENHAAPPKIVPVHGQLAGNGSAPPR